MGIGNTLETLLKEHNKNVNELAKAIGVSPQTLYSIIKRDNMKVDFDVLLKICDYLSVDVELFYKNKITLPDEESKERDASEKELMSWIETLDTVKIKRLLDILYLIELPDSDYEKISEIIRLFLSKDKQS